MSTKTLDDQDASVEYSGGWGKAGGPNEFDDTTTDTDVAGATATLHFSGTGISVFGTIPNIGRGTSPMSSYSVDGSTAGSFTGIQQTDVQYKVLFFQSAPLSSGDHTLIVTNTGNSTALFYLDFFQITESGPSTPSTPSTPPPGTTVTVTPTPSPPPPPPPPSTAQLPSSSPSRAASISSPSTTGTSSARSTSSSSAGTLLATVTITSSNGSTPSDVALNSSDHTKSSSSTGIIVGGVLGGLFVLGVLFFLFLYFLRNRNTGTSHARSLPPNASGPALQPLLPSTQLTQVTPFDLSRRSIEHSSSSGLLLQSTSNPLPSKLSQSGNTHVPSPTWGGQSHSTAGYGRGGASASDADSTARMASTDPELIFSPESSSQRHTMSGVPSIYGTSADAASIAQFDTAYDPPPRYM